jgi:hypothetical protein
MTSLEQAIAMNRLWRALLAFQTARALHLDARRRHKTPPQTEVEAVWDGPGHRGGETMHATATEVVAAFQAFSAAGLVAGVGDQHLITRAQRHLAERAA